jgi:SOS regulatory protein LexA
MNKKYFLKNIRTLLDEGFSEEELRDLCFYEHEFRSVHAQLSHTASKVAIIRQLLEYAEQKVLLDNLLCWAKGRNPVRFAEYQPYSTSLSASNVNIERKDQRVDKDVIKVPFLGYIAAGEPIQVPEGAFDSETDTIELPRMLIPTKGPVYILKVRGLSMIDALVNDGDSLVMLHTETAKNGDMVAVWLIDQQETTLKRFYRKGELIQLRPENKMFPTIEVDADNVIIQGRVVTIIRQFR